MIVLTLYNEIDFSIHASLCRQYININIYFLQNENNPARSLSGVLYGVNYYTFLKKLGQYSEETERHF